MITRKNLAEIAKFEAQQCFHGAVMQAESNLHPIIDLFPWSVDGADGKWCSAFVYYCCIKAGFQIPVKPDECCADSQYGYNLSSCYAWEEWVKADTGIAYYLANEDGFIPEAGDIVLYDKVCEGKENDHMGIVIENKEISIIAAEGNINNVSGVIERNKNSHIRAYIRLPDNYKYHGVYMDFQKKIYYAGSLGEINGEQFNKALQKLDLGNLIKAEKVTGGVGGQNAFLTSTKGEFVFRGNPHYDEQFDVEKFAVDNLRDKTSVSTAYPYIIDNDIDIFGYRYAIMPRLTGISFDGSKGNHGISKDERIRICHAMAEILAEIHSFTLEPENYNNDIKQLSFEYASANSYAEHIVNELTKNLENTPEVTSNDKKYINDMIEKNKNALSVPFKPCFVMGDFKEDNVLFSNDNGKWKVCAIFDFALSHFGDGEEDLSRICAMYINESNDASLAREFINNYIKLRTPREGFLERSKLYTIRERIDIWSWAKSKNQVWWNKNMTLKDWLETYLNIEI